MRPITLRSDKDRVTAADVVYTAEPGTVVSFRKGSRTLEQNNLFWEVMTDLSNAKPEGREWTKETWRDAILHATGHAVQFEEGLDDSGPFPVGFRSSALTKAQMSLCLEKAFEYGARHGVVFSVDRKRWQEMLG